MKKWRFKLFIVRNKPHDVEEYDKWIEVELPNGYMPMCVATTEEVS